LTSDVTKCSAQLHRTHMGYLRYPQAQKGATSSGTQTLSPVAAINGEVLLVFSSEATRPYRDRAGFRLCFRYYPNLSLPRFVWWQFS